MKIMPSGATILMLTLMLATPAWAQPGTGPGGGPGLHYGMRWDAKTVETVTGEVVAVERYTSGRGGRSYGLRLTLKTDKETLPVILGPGWYIEQQQVAIAPKDRVEIKGSRISLQGQPALIAAEVNLGSKILRLRDDRGLPLWAGPRSR